MGGRRRGGDRRALRAGRRILHAGLSRAIPGREGVRGYVAQAFNEERAPRVWVGVPIVEGNRAAIEWWAAVVENDAEITLVGVSVLRFDAKGLVTEQRDSWNQGEGLREPPPGWGR
jgi:hypothetical protein